MFAYQEQCAPTENSPALLCHLHPVLKYYQPKKYCPVRVVPQGGGECIFP